MSALASRSRFLSTATRFAVAALVLAPIHRARAQDGVDAGAAATIRNHYLSDLDTVHSKIVQLANAIPADKYSWRPAPGVRSVSEVLMHVASEWYYWVPMSIAGKAPADYGNAREKDPALEKDFTTKPQVVDQLNKSWAHAKSEVAGANTTKLVGKYKPWGVTVDEAALGMAGDLHEHLGQLIAYARTLGVKPPWSK
jgi:uncharacterized damage-inducible protein DinB